jgi:hypothetical protein
MCNTVRKISWLDATHSYKPPRLKFKSSTATTLKTAATLHVKTIHPEDGNRLLQDARCLSLRLPEVTSHATVMWTLTAIRAPNLTQNFYTRKTWNVLNQSGQTGNTSTMKTDTSQTIETLLPIRQTIRGHTPKGLLFFRLWWVVVK